MTRSIFVDENFDFEDIFGRCRKEYLQCEEDKPSLKNKHSNFCINVMKKPVLCGNCTENIEPAKYCENLGFYLEHIKSKLMDEKEKSCFFFFYKLKDMVKKYNGTCSSTKECYEEITKIHETPWGASISGLSQYSDSCNSFTDRYNINNEAFNKLHDLEELYNIYEEFNEHNNVCRVNDSIIKKCDEILKKYNKESVITNFKKKILEFQDKYSTLKEKYIECTHSPINGKTISFESSATSTETSTETALVEDAAMDAWRHTGTGVGAFTVVLLLIMLILYKVKNKFNLLNDQ